MPIEVTWLNERKDMLYFDYIGLWTWDGVFAVIEESNIMMDEVDHPVGTIVDFTNTVHLPDGLPNAMKKIAELRETHPNDSGETVYVKAQILTKAMFDIIQMTDPEVASVIKFTHTKTVEEAENLLLQVMQRL